VELSPEEARISLRDSGHGLGKAHGDHATDPFFTTKLVGTGMGLTLVRRIIEDHGGRLKLENREQGGTRATVVLPRIIEQE